MKLERKYARVEWERRFLLAGFPNGAKVTRTRRITDRYLTGANLRLRQMDESGKDTVFKLTQKVSEQSGARQGWITSIYLSKNEFCLLANLPAKILIKTRYSVPPFGIDAFEGELEGLVMAEAEFDSAEEASALRVPEFVVGEVTDDPRFTGGSLVSASQEDLQGWLKEYGITLHCLR